MLYLNERLTTTSRGCLVFWFLWKLYILIVEKLRSQAGLHSREGEIRTFIGERNAYSLVLCGKVVTSGHNMDGNITDIEPAPSDRTLMYAPRQYGLVNWKGLETLYKREVGRFLKVATQTVLAPVVSALLFMMVFRLAFPDKGDVNGVAFSDFIAPGIVMMAMLNNAFQNTSSSMAGAKIMGNTSDFLMPPLSTLELTIGFMGGAATRGLLVGAVTLISIALMGAADISVHSIPAMIFYSVLGSLFMGAVGLMGGVWAEKFDHIAAISNFVILPLTMLSGTFYSVSVLVQPFEALSHFNPFFHLIDGFRYSLTGVHEGNLLLGGLYTLGLTLLLATGCWLMLRSGYKLKA